MHYQTIYEDYKWYKHFNFTTKTKDGIENLFFAEVTKGKDNALVANCFCKIESNENGKYRQKPEKLAIQSVQQQAKLCILSFSTLV